MGIKKGQESSKKKCKQFANMFDVAQRISKIKMRKETVQKHPISDPFFFKFLNI